MVFPRRSLAVAGATKKIVGMTLVVREAVDNRVVALPCRKVFVLVMECQKANE